MAMAPLRAIHLQYPSRLQRQLLRFVPPFHPPNSPFPSSLPSPGNLMMNSGSFFVHHSCLADHIDIPSPFLSSHLSFPNSPSNSSPLPEASAPSLVSTSSASSLSSSNCSPRSPVSFCLSTDESFRDSSADVGPQHVDACVDVDNEDDLALNGFFDVNNDTSTRLPKTDLPEQAPVRSLCSTISDSHLKSDREADAVSSSWKQGKLRRYANRRQFAAHGREDLRRYNSRRNARCLADQIFIGFAKGRDYGNLRGGRFSNNHLPELSDAMFCYDMTGDEPVANPSQIHQLNSNDNPSGCPSGSSLSISPRRRLPIFEQICPSFSKQSANGLCETLARCNID